MSKIKAQTENSLSHRFTIYEILKMAESRIGAVSDSPKLDSQLLLAHALASKREWLIAHSDVRIDSRSIKKFEALLKRRLSGEPIAYIIGKRGFWQREFVVNPSVLVPRPETEILVEIILSHLAQKEQHIIDLGTGSGAIAISIAAERPDWIVTGIDRSPDAIAIAKKNAAGLNNIDFNTGNWCSDIAECSGDAIVSNPPYLCEDDPHLMKLGHEPMAALIAGPDGLEAIREIVPTAYSCLKIGGFLLVEHGYNQQDLVREIFTRAGYRRLRGIKDLNNLPRAVLGYRL